MTRDDLYKIYDGPIPEKIKRTMTQEALHHYYYAYLKQMEYRLRQHCRESIEAIQTWRITDLYPENVREMMLDRLSKALYRARFSAREIFDELYSEKS